MARIRSLRSRIDKAAMNENNRRASALIQSYRGQGMSWSEIAEKLNQAGFKASRGGPFQATQVQRIHHRTATQQVSALEKHSS